MLAAAPTTPPCFRHWRRSSSLHSSHIQRKNYFKFRDSRTPAGVPLSHFHSRGHKGKPPVNRYVPPCEKVVPKSPQAFRDNKKKSYLRNLLANRTRGAIQKVCFNQKRLLHARCSSLFLFADVRGRSYFWGASKAIAVAPAAASTLFREMGATS